ncbi:fibrinogen-like protein 1 [Mytilus galloprovincialis]|uniref:fibrinogen-like protein 1 n=1 Tax=Mytilus galloprovincialis TaxID=29158 RepID=UPI003F7CCE39
MNAMENILSFTLHIILMTTIRVDGKPCSNTSSDCQQVRMPLVSNKLNAPLVAELDVTAMNQQLATYIRDDIESTFSEDIKTLVKKEQDEIKVSMLQDYSSKLNKTKNEYDRHISKIVQNLKAKQSELQLEMSEVKRNISESESTFNKEIKDLLSWFQQRQESLELSMLSEYLAKLQQSQETNNQKIIDLADNLKSQFANLSQSIKEELTISTTYLQTQGNIFEDWKMNLMDTLHGIFAPIKKYKDCSDMKETIHESGVYTIFPDLKHGTRAYCDMSTDGGGWTVIQRRIDGTTSFDRNWVEYREGFGDSQKEYWLGNKYLNLLTTNGKYELRVDLTGTNNKMKYALYKTFTVSDENSQYKLSIGGYSGTAGDMMVYNNGNKFSTKDRDHDTWNESNCAKRGGWWHRDCGIVFLNIEMTKNKLYWNGFYYIKSTMMIRPIM